MSDRSEEDQPVPRPLSEGAPTRRSLSEGHSAARPLAEVNHEPVEPTYRRALRLIHFLIRGLIRRDWRDQAKLPQTGGVVVVVNHISNVDPIAVAQYLAFSGRWGKFLAKDSLFRVPVVGRVLAAAGQIPVHRNSRTAGDALSTAIERRKSGGYVLYEFNRAIATAELIAAGTPPPSADELLGRDLAVVATKPKLMDNLAAEPAVARWLGEHHWQRPTK